MEFYRCFLFIKSALLRTVYSNVDRDDDILTPVNIEYLAAIMAKPLSFSMSVNSKNDVQSELAKELGRSPKSAYSAISRLKHAGYLVQTEDGLIEPMNDLQELRKVTKNHLATLGCFPVSYLLNIVVSNQIPDHDVQ
jgi:DNA-binding MarR family transcriptional regulator